MRTARALTHGLRISQFLQIVAITALGLFAWRALEFVARDDGMGLPSRAASAQDAQAPASAGADAPVEPADAGGQMPAISGDVSGDAGTPKRMTASDVMKMRATDITEDWGREGELLESERTVLLRLAERRAEIERREEELTMRQRLIEAAEGRVESRIRELKELEKRLERLEAAEAEPEDTGVDNLVIMYEAMKPKDAARIFNSLDLGVLIAVAENMKPRSMAAVMAAMDSQAAQRLTLALARRQAEATDRQPEPSPLPRIGDG